MRSNTQIRDCYYYQDCKMGPHGLIVAKTRTMGDNEFQQTGLVFITTDGAIVIKNKRSFPSIEPGITGDCVADVQGYWLKRIGLNDKGNTVITVDDYNNQDKEVVVHGDANGVIRETELLTLAETYPNLDNYYNYIRDKLVILPAYRPDIYVAEMIEEGVVKERVLIESSYCEPSGLPASHKNVHQLTGTYISKLTAPERLALNITLFLKGARLTRFENRWVVTAL